MRVPTATEPTHVTARLLEFWERHRRSSVNQRAFELLRLAKPETDPAVLRQYSIGQRDGVLLELRQVLLGNVVDATVHCPACQGELEFQFELDTIRCCAPKPQTLPLQLKIEGYEVTFRLPTVEDALLLDGQTADKMTTGLIQRALVQCCSAGSNVLIRELPESVLNLVAERIEALDPESCIMMVIPCPNCARSSEVDFDIPSFLFDEVDAWARRLLRDVHQLALAYGWSEASILEMSAARRRTYLELSAS